MITILGLGSYQNIAEGTIAENLSISPFPIESECIYFFHGRPVADPSEVFAAHADIVVMPQRLFDTVPQHRLPSDWRDKEIKRENVWINADTMKVTLFDDLGSRRGKTACWWTYDLIPDIDKSYVGDTLLLEGSVYGVQLVGQHRKKPFKHVVHLNYIED